MASEQPQPSSEKFTSYEYTVSNVLHLLFFVSCDDGSRVVDWCRRVGSELSAQLKALDVALVQTVEGGSAVSRNENRLHMLFQILNRIQCFFSSMDHIPRKSGPTLTSLCSDFCVLGAPRPSMRETART